MKFYWHWNGAAMFVKTEEYFIAQGGLTAEWGKSWTLIEADSIEDARARALRIDLVDHVGGPRT